MKSVKQILEQYDTLDIRTNTETKKLVDLVHLGLLAEENLPLISRALQIDAELMSSAERRALVDLMESVTSFLVAEKQNDVPNIKDDKKREDENKNQPPIVLYFTRKSIRMFPNDLKVAIYYSKQLDRYISIPFGPKTTEIQLNMNEQFRVVPASSKFKKLSASDKLKWGNKTGALIRKNRENEEDRQVSATHGDKVASVNKKAREREQRNSNDAALRGRMNTKELAKSKIRGGAGEAAGRGFQSGGLIGAAINTTRYGIHRALGEEKINESFLDFGKKKKTKAPKFKLDKPVKSKSKIKKYIVQKPKEEKNNDAPATKSSAPAPKRENLSALVQKYKKAHHDHSLSTGTTYRVWDSDKGKHVDKNAKTELASYKERLASKIRSSGGEVPTFSEPEKVKRDPTRKPPPAMAEENVQEIAPIIPLALGTAARLAPRFGGAIVRGAKNLAGKLVKKPKSVLNDKKSFVGKPNKTSKPSRLSRLGSAAAGAAGVAAAVATGATKALSDKNTDHRYRGTSTERRSNIVGGSETSSASTVNLQKRRGETPVAESNLNRLKTMVEQKTPTELIPFGDTSVTINNRIARKVLSVYESLNSKNKKKVESMLNESIDSFRKVINFAIKA